MIDPLKDDDQAPEPAKPVIENEALRNNEEVDERKKQDTNVTGEAYPGYPTYPASEDIMNPGADVERVDADVENITRTRELTDADMIAGADASPRAEGEFPMDNTDEEDEIGIVPGTEADVTEDDLLALGAIDQDMDMGEDESLKGKGFPLEQTGEDLDVPGQELDDDGEAIGEEDEENNYYSLGGDSKEGLEEDASAEEV